MRALVTGGCGFLGSHLVDRLLAGGARVEALDDLSSGREENLAGALHRGATLVRGDVRDRDLAAARVRGADLVFHLAGAVGVRRVAADPAGTWSRNVEGTASVLSACAEAGVRCVVTSTSEAYGPTSTGTLREDAPVVLDPTGRRDVYAVSKVAGESLAAALFRSASLPVTVVRLFNVVGPRQSDRYGMVLPRFARAAVRGEPLGVHGDGRQTRCFLHALDAVEALVALAQTSAAVGSVVNVGGDEEVSVLHLAREVVRRAGTASPIRFVPFEEVFGPGFLDPPRRRPDVSRLRALVGFAPTRTLLDAIDDALRDAQAVARDEPRRAAAAPARAG